MKVSFIERVLWLSVVVVLAVSLYWIKSDLDAMTGWIDLQNEQLTEIDALLDDAERRQSELQQPAPEEVVPIDEPIGPAAWEIRQFQAQGLSDPIADLKNDLMRKPELINIPGVLGGTMRIYADHEIVILPGNWAYATFEDGHTNGGMLLEFGISNGEIQWTVIRSQQF